MAIWNRHRKADLKEAETAQQLNLTDIANLPFYQFAAGLTSLRGMGSQLSMNSTLKQSMLKDPVISQIINMWISDTLSKDVITHNIYEVNIGKNKDTVTDETISLLNDLIKYLQENSNLDDLLDNLLYKVITDGIANVKLGFIDAYEDTKIKLFESNKKRVSQNQDKLWEFETDKQGNTRNKLLEAPTYDDYEDDFYNKRKYSKDKILRAQGRYYFEILPARVVPLKHKGITIMYLDLDNSMKILNPRNINTFVNTRGGVKTLSVKDDPTDIVSTVYEIPLGQSFIENAVTPWSMLNTTEDCTILALMTRSAIYRVFQIEVGALSSKQTDELMMDFKKRITARETIDVRSKYYSSAQTQVPLGDSLFVPVRNGVGSVNIQAVGGDLDIKTQVPLDYFREQLLASLGIPKTLIYGDESGALINTSATRQDIRYLRTIQQFTRIMSLGLEGIFKDYLTMLGVDLRDITLQVDFSQINNEDALRRIEFEQQRQDALGRAIDSLKNMGIDITSGSYKKTRELLIKRYLDKELLDAITEDEKDLPPQQNTPPEEGNADLPLDDIGGAPLPPHSEDTDMSLPPEGNEEEPIENIETPEETPAVEPTNNTDVNEEPPYSLG